MTGLTVFSLQAEHKLSLTGVTISQTGLNVISALGGYPILWPVEDGGVL